MLLASVNVYGFDDRVYEFAQNLCNDTIKEIESKHKIVDVDGIPFNEDDGDGVMWYDEYRDDFILAVYEKIKSSMEG